MALAVVIIDVRASVGHQRVAQALGRLAGLLQDAFPDSLFQVAWGDEMEGVLPSPVDVWNLFVRAREELPDLPFYMGVGIGEMSDYPVLELHGSVHELNGTAFKAAREAVARAKRETGIPLAFDVHGNPALSRALCAYPQMLNAAYRQMTRKQKAYFDDLILGMRHSAIAQRHGVGQPTVSKVLQRAGAGQLATMREGLTSLLEFVAQNARWGAANGEVQL